MYENEFSLRLASLILIFGYVIEKIVDRRLVFWV